MNTRKYHYNNSTMTIVFGNILDSKEGIFSGENYKEVIVDAIESAKAGSDTEKDLTMSIQYALSLV